MKTKAAQRRQQKLPWILLCLGALILAYPVIATFYTNYEQQQVLSRTRTFIASQDTSLVDKALEDAHAFNKTLKSGPILDPWLDDYVPDGKEYVRYRKLLDFNGVIGRLSIPKINVSLPIYHGTTDQVLAKGVGHLFGTSLPVGGPNTHAVLTAHSGFSSATLFDNLPDLEPGDTFHIDVASKVLTYKVHQVEIVVPNDKQSLIVHEGKDEVTLITCTPYGINTHRLLVHAHRIPTPKDAQDIPLTSINDTWDWWMLAVILIPIAATVFLVFVQRKRTRKSRSYLFV